MLLSFKVKPEDRFSWSVEGSELVVGQFRCADSFLGWISSMAPFLGLESEKAAIRSRLG
jgi:hypothetical protein